MNLLVVNVFMDSKNSMNVFTIICLTIISACLILSCCGYILVRRKNRKQQQTEFINQCYAPEIQDQIYTIEMPYTQSPSNEQSTISLRDKPPPSYETVEISIPSKY